MTSRLHFELFMREMRTRALAAAPKQISLAVVHPDDFEDVGAVRLSRIEAAIRETRDAADQE